MRIDMQPVKSPMRRSRDIAGIGAFEIDAGMEAKPVPATRHRKQEPFEIRNVSGKTARGVEIEIAGIADEDVFQAYYLSRHGSPRVARTRPSIRMTFESLFRAPIQSLWHAIAPREKGFKRASLPYIWELALFGGGGSDRFCIELSAQDVVVTYRWLVATDESIETLVACEAPAHVHDARERR